MKKIILASALALSCVASATAAEVGIYLGDSTFVTYSSHKAGATGLTFNGHWSSQDTGDYFGWQQNKITFRSYGIGVGYNYSELMDKLSIEGVAGYGLSNVAVDNSNLSSIDNKTGLYYSIGANYQVLNHVPFSIGAKLISVPTFDWATSTGAKTYGGISVVFGGSYAY